METILQGRGSTVLIRKDGPLIVIGERINPSGRRRLAECLAQGDMSLVRQEALAQVEVGAQAIDVNVGTADVDEERILPLAVKTVAETVDVPILIDTANYKALAAALAICPGKPLVNSVTGDESILETVLPLVKTRGCAVIGLCMDEKGIPVEANQRLEIARRIVRAAQDQGIGREDVIIDPLAMTVGTDYMAGAVTLEAVRLIAANLGVNIVFGASNISFGLPDRTLLNRTFLAMAVAAGATCAIADPLDVEIRRTIATCDLVLGRDEFATRFIDRCRAGW